MLISEIFAIKLGGTIPRKYAAGFTPDMHFIRQNGLADMFFTHGIALRFDPERGVGFPILTRKGDKIEVFFCDLKSYDLNIYKNDVCLVMKKYTLSIQRVLIWPVLLKMSNFYYMLNDNKKQAYKI